MQQSSGQTGRVVPGDTAARSHRAQEPSGVSTSTGRDCASFFLLSWTRCLKALGTCSRTASRSILSTRSSFALATTFRRAPANPLLGTGGTQLRIPPSWGSELLPKSHALQKMVAMRRELAAVWERSMATHEQLVAQLQDWCRRAETTEIKPLAEFSRQLRCYA
jgi:hypothetical protein